MKTETQATLEQNGIFACSTDVVSQNSVTVVFELLARGGDLLARDAVRVPAPVARIRSWENG
jgi:sulfur transfer complex TusBCD TusB component (DsrH family)